MSPFWTTMLVVLAIAPIVILLVVLYVGGLSKIRFKKQWEANWENHHIVVRTWYNLML